MRNNYANYTQTLHLTPHLSDFPSVTKCIVYALNYTQTIHKLYIETFQTLHKNYTRKPTPQLYILFLNTNQTDEADESGVTNVTCVTYVTNVTGVTKGRVGDGVNGTSPRRHRGVTGAEFHHFI